MFIYFGGTVDLTLGFIYFGGTVDLTLGFIYFGGTVDLTLGLSIDVKFSSSEPNNFLWGECKEASIIIYLWRSSRSLESCVNYQLVDGATCASSLLVYLDNGGKLV